MSRLVDFLISLTDMELAQFYKYRFHQFLPNSKQSILHELRQRKMNPENLEQYIYFESHEEKSMVKGEYCSRCYSTKLYTAEEKETLEFKYDTVEVDAYYKTCLVCLYSPEKPEKYERHKFVDLFGFIRAFRKKRR
ncbi:MAG: hypothetical protein WEA99_05815 [Brumimicrobium sp.]